MINNTVILKGIMHDVPDIRKTPDCKEFAKFTILVKHDCLDTNISKTEFAAINIFPCIAFSSQALAEAKQLRRGAPVNATGKLRRNIYENSEGTLREETEIIIIHLEELYRLITI